MHQVTYSIRRIAPDELPTTVTLDGLPRAMTLDELRDVGIVPVDPLDPSCDLYSCADQARRDSVTLEWAPVGILSGGVVVAAGSFRARHAALPPDVAAVATQAIVVRTEDPAQSAALLAEENVAFVAAVLEEAVGDVAGAPLLDLSSPAALLLEAQRLADRPDTGVERVVVPAAAVTAGDVVEVAGLAAHCWHGESPH